MRLDEEIGEPSGVVGEPVHPGDPRFPRVAEVLIDKGDDSDMDVLIVRTGDGRWWAQYDDGPGVFVADSASELAGSLWKGGDCPVWVGEALHRVGWLRLDDDALRHADEESWRQLDPLGTSVLAERP